MSEDKKLKEEFCVLLNISSNLEEEKLLHRYKMFIRDIKRILKDNNFNEYEINLEDNIISINILNKTLKEIANVFKCLAYIQIMVIEKYKFLLKGVVEYNKKDLVDSFEEEKEFNYPLIMLGDSIKEDMLENFSQSLIKISDKFYINYLSVYYEDNNEDNFFNIMLKHKKFIKERLIENSKEFYQIMVKLKDNERNILEIREKYLYLLEYHKKIVLSLIKFEGYEEDRRRKCSINLEEII